MSLNSPGLAITKSGPVAVGNDNNIQYQITVTDPNAVIEILVEDKIPDDTDFVDCGNNPPFLPPHICFYNPFTRTVSWKATDNVGGAGLLLGLIPGAQAFRYIPGPINLTYTLTVHPTKPNFYAINNGATGFSIPTPNSTNSATTQGYTPPSANDCSGKYRRYMDLIGSFLGAPYAQNYGDPNCDFTKNALDDLIKQQDPQFENLWFNIIVPGESGYNADAWASPVGVQCSLDCAGAWGLFQMSSTAQAHYTAGKLVLTSPPYQPPPAGGKNGQYDRGDVNWQLQLNNAILYNRTKLHCSFRYWATARADWGKFSC